MSAETLEKVRGIAADVLQIDKTSLTPESSPQSVESWDSVQHLNLVLAMEQEFGFTFSPEEMDRMKTVGQIADVVAAKRGA